MSGWITAIFLAISASLASQAAPQLTALESLAQAESRWQQRKPAAYEFDVVVRCFCGPGLPQGPVTFRIRDTESLALQELEPVIRRLYESYNTVEKLFAAIRRSLARGQFRVAIEYDPYLGYPVRAAVDPVQMIADDELFLEVAAFRTTESSATPLVPEARP